MHQTSLAVLLLVIGSATSTLAGDCCYTANTTNVNTFDRSTNVTFNAFDSDAIQQQNAYNATISLPEGYSFMAAPKLVGQVTGELTCSNGSAPRTLQCNSAANINHMQVLLQLRAPQNAATGTPSIKLTVLNDECQLDTGCSLASVMSKQPSDSGDSEEGKVFLGPFGYVSKTMAIGIGIGFGLVILIVAYMVLQRVFPSKNREGGRTLNHANRRNNIPLRHRDDRHDDDDNDNDNGDAERGNVGSPGGRLQHGRTQDTQHTRCDSYGSEQNLMTATSASMSARPTGPAAKDTRGRSAPQQNSNVTRSAISPLPSTVAQLGSGIQLAPAGKKKNAQASPMMTSVVVDVTSNRENTSSHHHKSESSGVLTSRSARSLTLGKNSRKDASPHTRSPSLHQQRSPADVSSPNSGTGHARSKSVAATQYANMRAQPSTEDAPQNPFEVLEDDIYDNVASKSASSRSMNRSRSTRSMQKQNDASTSSRAQWASHSQSPKHADADQAYDRRSPPESANDRRYKSLSPQTAQQGSHLHLGDDTFVDNDHAGDPVSIVISPTVLRQSSKPLSPELVGRSFTRITNKRSEEPQEVVENDIYDELSYYAYETTPEKQSPAVDETNMLTSYNLARHLELQDDDAYAAVPDTSDDRADAPWTAQNLVNEEESSEDSNVRGSPAAKGQYDGRHADEDAVVYTLHSRSKSRDGSNRNRGMSRHREQGQEYARERTPERHCQPAVENSTARHQAKRSTSRGRSDRSTAINKATVSPFDDTYASTQHDRHAYRGEKERYGAAQAKKTSPVTTKQSMRRQQNQSISPIKDTIESPTSIGRRRPIDF
ncbi:hypothetical protein THASP1DRAFT_27844 [Thamnocephalis sphaerospora]|uniref:Mid2 domain-containing protein n=1 Tax=Thamnocephalis sphaerospora TaxID=78915 RepID=A0A4P9XY55_9FUNG|nr:hypothetical protein THASP1DRAFT_27844 [Thamnocephalis sphaerospora]|eukprot:RKP10360.1 hypothetical protein THASP1DRAFT_27844 [Thamnocephalis sphaerospora]